MSSRSTAAIRGWKMADKKLILWDKVEPPFDGREPKEPEGGWKPACKIKDHTWVAEVEEGILSIRPSDRHTDEQIAEMDPRGPSPACVHWWEREDLVMSEFPVKVKVVDDSTPSTPAGPAEYGYWIEVEVDKDRD